MLTIAGKLYVPLLPHTGMRLSGLARLKITDVELPVKITKPQRWLGETLPQHPAAVVAAMSGGCLGQGACRAGGRGDRARPGRFGCGLVVAVEEHGCQALGMCQAT